MIDPTSVSERDELERVRLWGERQAGAPGGARQHVRNGTDQGVAARPGGATQNSGGAILGNAEQADEPRRGAE